MLVVVQLGQRDQRALLGQQVQLEHQVTKVLQVLPAQQAHKVKRVKKVQPAQKV